MPRFTSLTSSGCALPTGWGRNVDGCGRDSAFGGPAARAPADQSRLHNEVFGFGPSAYPFK